MADEEGEREPRSRPTADGREPQTRSPSLFFCLALVPVVMLVVTVLAFTASLFGDPHAPAQRWLLRSVGWILAAEVLASLLLGLMAMADDRRRTIEAHAARDPSERFSDDSEQDHRKNQRETVPMSPECD